MSEELRECPFCGEINLKKMTYLDLVGWMYWIECKRCDYVRAVSMADMDDAIRKWNTRPAEDKLRAENERLKSKLELIKKYVLRNRDILLFSLKEKHDSVKYSEFAFCQSLLELINAKDINVPTKLKGIEE